MHDDGKMKQSPNFSQVKGKVRETHIGKGDFLRVKGDREEREGGGGRRRNLRERERERERESNSLFFFLNS